MKITVFGPGAIGAQIAARLAGAGNNVSVIARGANLAAIRADGITLLLRDEHRNFFVEATDDPATLPPQDLVIVTVKANALLAATPALSRLVRPETQLLYVMNGLPWWFTDGLAIEPGCNLRMRFDPHGAIEQLAPRRRLLWGVIRSGGELIAPGIVRNTTPSRNLVTIGHPDGNIDAPLEHIVERLQQAGYDADATTDIRSAIWQKLLLNAATSVISTLTERNNLETASDPETRAIAIGCMREIIDAGRVLGMRADMDPAALTDPARANAHYPSLSQDLKAGKPLELDHTVLAVRDITRAAGVKAPYLTTLAGLIAARAAASRQTHDLS